ncbi:MAG: PepSY-associated TM helix domain-containing protein [Bacteroidota bacterium]
MKFNRKTFFKIHSWVGVKLSIIFFIVCLSGTLATLSHEMDWLFNPMMRATPSEKLASKNLIIQNLAKEMPEAKIMYWQTLEDYLCDQLQVLENGQRYFVFANRYTGEIQGRLTLTFQRYFRDLHYYLFIPFQVGHFTVLIFGFLLFISLVTALLFLKNWVRKLFQLKTGKGSVVLFKSLHQLTGLWSVLFVFLFSVTGIWYFLERTNTAGISKIANTKMPKLEVPYSDTTAFKNIDKILDYDRVVAAAQAVMPTITVKDIALPRKLDQPVYVTGKSHVPLVRNRANRIYVHPETYEVVQVQRAEELNTTTWLNDIADPLHFGYWGGLVTKVIWFFGGLAITGLVGTGIWISLKRKVKNEKQRQAQRLGKWKWVNGVIFGLMAVIMYYILIKIYAASWVMLTAITLGWAILIGLAWYIYVYRIDQAVKAELLKQEERRQRRALKRQVF